MISNRRIPSNTCPASSPPTAVSITSCTSSTLMPYRAIASRLILIWSCGWPSTCSVCTSAAPRTAVTTRWMSSPAETSRSRSSPYNTIASCALTPLSSSSTRLAIGCEKLSSMPGTLPNAFARASTSSGLERPVPHCFSGLRVTMASTLLTGSGSPPASARPVLETTSSISGNRLAITSSCVAVRMASSRLADGGRVMR